MKHDDLILFLLQMSVMLAAAVVFGELARKLRQPALLGELAGGILLGPTFLGVLAPGFQGWLFPAAGPVFAVRETIIKLGMIFFLFAAGLQVNLSYLRQRKLSTVLTSAAGITVPFALGLALVLLWPQLWGDQARGNSKVFALFMGTALSISALPVIARILADLGLLGGEVGAVVMAAVVADDLVGWSLFAIIVGQMAPGQIRGVSLGLTIVSAVVFLALVLSAGRWVSRRVLTWVEDRLSWPGAFIAVTVVMVLIPALGAEALGIHAFFGAFLVGVAVRQTSEKRKQAHELVYQFVVSFLAPLYFVSLGLRTDFATNFCWPIVLVVLTVACLGKIGGVSLAARLGGLPTRRAFAVGFAMNARGAMEMIMAATALDYGLIDQRVFVALIVMAMATSAVSVPVIRYLVPAAQPPAPPTAATAEAPDEGPDNRSA